MRSSPATACLLLLALAGCLAPATADACRCSWKGSFSRVNTRMPTVVVGTVTEHTARTALLQLDSVLAGEESSAVVRLWCDQGMQCWPPVGAFPIGTKWVIAVRPFQPPETALQRLRDAAPAAGLDSPHYITSSCGAYSLRVSDGNAIGAIEQPDRHSEETMKLAALEELIRRQRAAP